MNICVFCSANELEEKYTKPAGEFATLLAKKGHTLIWGGSDKGVMKVIATAAQEAGGRIVGVSMKLLEEHARKDADEMIVAKDLSERKGIMFERANAFVVMPGGIGTLDEVTHILELKKHKEHDKPIAILDTDNFYEGLRHQLSRMEKDGFLTRPASELVYFAPTPEKAFDYLETSAP